MVRATVSPWGGGCEAMQPESSAAGREAGKGPLSGGRSD